MTRSRYRIFESGYPYFMTATVVGWLPVFSTPQCVAHIFESWRFLQTNRQINIFGYVILENHLHWIASGRELAKQVGHFKSFTARQILDELQATGRKSLLQELSYYK